jgi:hypothetical protein
MKRQWITTGALTLALLGVSSGTALAQARGNDYRERNNDEWNHRDHFNDQDRQVTRDWYLRNRSHLGRGWTRRDRLSPEMERRLRLGARLDPALRRQMYWLPADLTRRYGPAPRGYRYAIIGGNIVMLDPDYRVHDIFRIDVQIR